ncbi:glycoside hydrolase superfamily [Endogone sp. FLAS-F59071]|nr:glycoside hydrolase superfamily [Endogone sp. FLAS-F59071]|eukprot:RUS20038.1 glycoside hydrolase superfamily [Endogone sp. FLAS-F59071]
MKVTVSSVLAAIFLATAPALAAVDFTGVNEAGADFGSVGGVYGTNYMYPADTSLDYFTKNKANIVRLPFLWERLQPTLNATFDATELSRLKAIVKYATGVKGLHVLLDPHNYARYNGQLIGSSAVSYGNFYYFWKELAGEFKHNTKIIFGLMNEPNSMPTEQVLAAMQAGLDGVRAAGAKQLALVPGNAWTGAHSWAQNWYGTANSVVMLNIRDPAHNYAYDMHQYLDDGSGTSAECASTTVGSEMLVAATQWLRQNNKKAFLSEFGFGANPTW